MTIFPSSDRGNEIQWWVLLYSDSKLWIYFFFSLLSLFIYLHVHRD